METVFYGELKCSAFYKSGDHCRNNAYYIYDSKYVCGVHSNKNNRVELPKNKDKKKITEQNYSLHLRVVEKSRQDNIKSGKKGSIICTKMQMMKPVPLIEGYLNVFPNYKHQNRKDGFGCKSLSPMSIGPIVHNQPELPICKNLENFHQNNKVFSSEVDTDGNILPVFYETQKKAYLDDTPHRHKESSKSSTVSKNVPLFSVWKTKDGIEKRFTYIESRQFYCNYYERFALKDENFLKLKELLNGGTNLNICGYDAYLPDKNIEEHYLDAKRPFGHELVLYTLLTHDEKDYPWRKYKTEDF